MKHRPVGIGIQGIADIYNIFKYPWDSEDAYKLNNTKYVSDTGVSHNNGAAILLKNMPNYYAPLKIRFSHTEAVKVQNCKLRIFDRSDIENAASGVTTKVYEVRHPKTTTAASGLAYRGDGKTQTVDHTWLEFDSTDDGKELTFTNSPGMSGINSAGETAGTESEIGWSTNTGSTHASAIHDWYVALSASPESIGTKTNYGLYFTCEYL